MKGTPKFEDSRRGDAGRDGGGIYRHIARDTRIPNILTKGDYSTLGWREVCAALYSKPGEDKLKINLIDTVILEGGEILLYLYTNVDGNVAKKPVGFHNFQNMRDAFFGFLEHLQPGGHQHVAVCHTSSSTGPMDSESFNSFCMGTHSQDVQVIQVFVPSKGDPSTWVTFRTDYWLDRNARPILKTIRLGLRPEVSGSKNKDTTVNMNKKSNDVMEATCCRVVNRVQEALQCKVVRLSLDFVEDCSGKLWLVQSTECLHAVEKILSRRQLSPENRKLNRSSHNTHAGGEELSSDSMYGVRNNSSNSALRPSHRAGAVGHHCDERVSKRQLADSMTAADDDLVDSILQRGSSSSSRPSRRLSPVQLQRPPSYTAVLGAPAAPSSTLSFVSTALDLPGTAPPRRDLDTAMFGSSQLQGCAGDFCNFDLTYIENKEVMGMTNGAFGSSGSALSDFRRRLLEDTVGAGDEDEDFLSAASTGGGGGVVHSTVSSSRVHGAEGNLSSSRDPAGGAGREAFSKLPFRIIIQTRQEMPLVNKLLKRIRKGDDVKLQSMTAEQRKQMQMYVTEDNYGDLCISGKLPSHYYKDVFCCSTCFKVYKIITDARAEAIKSIEKKNDRSKKKKNLLSTGGGGGAPAVSSSSFNLHTSSSSSVLLEAGGGLNDQTPYEQDRHASLQVALQAIEGLTKLDVAEVRTMSKPPAAVAVVLEAVVTLLTGKTLSFQEARRLLGGGEAFLLMLREFQLENVTDSRLRMIEPYVDNPVFRPENVLPVSYCASKFCGWVLGVVQAARWQRGAGHMRSNLLEPSSSSRCEGDEGRGGGKQRKKQQTLDLSSSGENLTFVQKLERKKALQQQQQQKPSTANMQGGGSLKKPKHALDDKMESAGAASTMFSEFAKKKPPSHISRSMDENSIAGMVNNQRRITSPIQNDKGDKQSTRRQQVAMIASQKRSIDRLASQNKSEGNMATAGIAKSFRCFDGITKMPYTVLGTVSLDVTRCNFIIVHDFFDTHDATAIACKPLVQRHSGAQVFCFNYPGQAGTVWPRPSAVERQRGAKEQVVNNDWVADRLHELLQHAEQNGDILLTNPFHLVGIGNGAAIAAAFALRYGRDSLYADSLKSLVSVNGFLYPDPQLSAVLHSAAQVFETTPHSRPDIPISYWSRFVFSEDYLARINPNLALNIYTAVSNPITNDGRTKITRGCLRHLDLRGSLNPDGARLSGGESGQADLRPLRVPVIVLQSTENMLVSAANVDPFLNGRSVQHLWSHQQNIVSETVARSANDPSAQWVGGLCHGPGDYAKYSLLGKSGLEMLLATLQDARGAFVMWTRAGHALLQENKTPVLDLLDALANPSLQYFGLATGGDRAGSTFKDSVQLRDTAAPSVQKAAAAATTINVDDEDVFDEKELLAEEEGGGEEEEEEEEEEEDSMVLFEVKHSRVAGRQEAEDESGEGAGAPATSPVPQPTTAATLVMKMTQPGEDQGLEEGTGSSVGRLLSKDQGGDNLFVTDQYDAQLHTFLPSPLHATTSSPLHGEEEGKEEEEEEEEKEARVEAQPPVVMQHKSAHPAPPLPKQNAHVGETEISDVVSRSTTVPLPVPVVDNNTSPRELRDLYKKNVTDMVQVNEDHKTKESTDAETRHTRILSEQEKRRERYEAEDEELLSRLDSEAGERAKERERADRLRRLELQNVERLLVSQGVVPPWQGGGRDPVHELPDMRYSEPAPLPAALTEKKDPLSSLDRMVADEAEARKQGVMSMEQYEAVKSKMVVAQMDRDQKTRHMETSEQERYYDDSARLLQRVARGFLGRARAERAARTRALDKVVRRGVTVFQAVVRGCIGREKAAEAKRNYLANLLRGDSIITIQRVRRGYNARKRYKKLRRFVAARDVQRAFRGYIGRSAASRERARLAALRKKERAASKIQSTWRMKIAREEFRSMRVHVLAAVEMQRTYRGYLGRKVVARRREWESAAPGPERIELGLKMIEESKVAFERQQEEIDALHRAQERAEARVSHIHAELKDSEKELVVLERELQEIDQIERDLQIMTHERDVLALDIKDAAGMPRTAIKGHETAVLGKEPQLGEREDSEVVRRKKAEAYALELTIQIKRAEREKKRQELETEFASVFQEVEKKRKALERLEASLADMESTRERKDREFRRLQKNLMQLLLEQKQELDDLREKGIQLETATATTAAAATATAQKAKEHEKKSTAMFSQTEELMKFQFMSMSLSYFSSLNMLNQLRDMNSDTTSSAVSSSADAAAAAAAAATAANLPSMKKLNLGADDFVSLNIQKKKAELAASEKAEREVKAAKMSAMPANVAMWSVDDVTRWLETLSLGQYVQSFREATVDGAFLMELREEDLVQVLGVTHKLHVRKIIISRERLRPLSKDELKQKEQVEAEDKAEKSRKMVGVPDMDTVFSQARNGRLKRLEESLNLGFPMESEDTKGNTLLLVAASNSNRRMVEMLVVRGAKVNHQNSQGQTALHFAMAFDKEGLIAEYLIQNGADDTLENIDGLTPYDGIK